MVFGTTNCNQKIAAFLESQAYRRMNKDPIDRVEHKTEKIFIFEGAPTALTGVFEAFSALQAPKYLQARSSLEAQCEHHWGPSLLLGQTSGGPTELSQWQLSP
jgi:hypothetical protein